jgi:hypothetical protein
VSKFPLDVLQRRVFPFTEADDPDVILGAAFGEDMALTRERYRLRRGNENANRRPYR